MRYIITSVTNAISDTPDRIGRYLLFTQSAGSFPANFRLEVNVAPELGYVTLDQQKFKQVLYNLLSNAVKFTDDGSKVEIRVAMYDAYRFKLSVQDTGIGIKTEDLPRLFKKFEQLGSSVARRYEGTGLGLALTRTIVELHGGAIGVESEVGKSSNFTVVLPRCLGERVIAMVNFNEPY